MKTMIVALGAALGLWLQSSPAQAGDGCCSCCGCACQPEMTCHLVKYMKKVTVTCYGCKCNNICIPGPSCKGCEHCEGCCDNGGQCGQCNGGCGCDDCNHKPDCHLRWFDWCPTCACPITVKQLQKFEVTKEVCAYKWEAVPMCAGCAEKAHEDDKKVPPTLAPPAPPKSAQAKATDAISLALPGKH